MSKDWSSTAALAQRLIGEYGREISLFKKSETPVDSSKPWLGPADQVGSDTTEVVASAVFVQADNDFAFGADFFDALGLARRSQTRFIVYSTTDLTGFDTIQDGTSIWKIDIVRMLKPGDTVLLYDIEVKQ